jgi:hypothetical protein
VPTTPNFTVFGTLIDELGNIISGGKVQITLQNYGRLIPCVAGAGEISNTVYVATANASGFWSATVFGEDQILVGTQTSLTTHTVQFFSADGSQQSPTQTYQFIGGGSHEISTLIPLGT